MQEAHFRKAMQNAEQENPMKEGALLWRQITGKLMAEKYMYCLKYNEGKCILWCQITGKLKVKKQQKDVKYHIGKYKALQIITAL